MSKKFFSLIHGQQIHVAPEQKVIPGDSISTILDAQEVLHLVQEDAEKYKIEVAGFCETLKEKAEQEGFKQGYSEWIEKIAELEEEIKKVRKDAESMIVPIALKAAKKIVGRELELSDSAIVDIIKNSLKSVATHKKIKIYVNKKEFETVEKNKDQLKKVFEHLESLSILTQDDIDPAGCIIETEGGIINAQLENQWMIMENAFQRLLSKENHALESEKAEALQKAVEKNKESSQERLEKEDSKEQDDKD